MRANLPPAPQNYEAAYFIRSFAAIDRIVEFAVTRNEATSSLLLLSPGGLVYKVTVADDGTLSTTSVPLGQSGANSF
jgi:hypothetical protein